MKKASAFALSLFLFASATAGETTKGTIVKLDPAARSITFRPDGAEKERVLPVDEAVDLGKPKVGAQATLTVENGLVKEIRTERKRRAPGY